MPAKSCLYRYYSAAAYILPLLYYTPSNAFNLGSLLTAQLSPYTANTRPSPSSLSSNTPSPYTPTPYTPTSYTQQSSHLDKSYTHYTPAPKFSILQSLYTEANNAASFTHPTPQLHTPISPTYSAASFTHPTPQLHTSTPQSSVPYTPSITPIAATTTPENFDLIIVGCGVGGHGAALHAVSNGLKVAIISTANDLGGTCVNRGCIPSKALLASSGQIFAMKDSARLKKLGITLDGSIKIDREAVSAHTNKLKTSIKSSLGASLKRNGIQVYEGLGKVVAPNTVEVDNTTRLTAKDIIVSPGSVPTVPRGVQVDGVNVFTSDDAVKLNFVPQWILIIGAGFIGVEFSEIYSSLGSEVTVVDAMDHILPSLDSDVAKVADRLLMQERGIDVRMNVIVDSITVGKSGQRPTVVKLKSISSGEIVDTLEVDAVMVATGRKSNADTLGLEALGIQLEPGSNIVPVDSRMRVISQSGEIVPNLYCIGDANGKLMLAHAASAQGVSAVESILNREHIVKHNQIPATCYTHPAVSSVGLTEKGAAELARLIPFPLGKVLSYYRANSKSLAEHQMGGIGKLLYRKDNGTILGAQVVGDHADSLIQQIANSMAANQTVAQMALTVHTHPTLSEIVLDAYKEAAGLLPH